ncbi:MAG: sugar phosphate isomerase/epimerase family protein, partial [Solirubrobacteraceae bacterium]
PSEAEQPRLQRSLDAAERLGTRLVRVFSYYVDGHYRELREVVVRRMSAMAREAERRGLVLVMENESGIYGDLPDRCLDVLESVGSPALRCAFDPANFVQCGADPMRDAWSRLQPYVVHVHIKDAVPIDRTGIEPYPAPAPPERVMGAVRPAGEGAGGLRELLAALIEREYQGILTLEPHLTARLPELSGAERFRVAVSALRGLLDEMGGTA